MKSSTVFALIVAGHVGTAYAQPKQEEISGRVGLDDPATDNSDGVRSSSDWVALATPTPASHGTEYIIVGADAGTFSQLRLAPASGRTNVVKVKVFFADGDAKTVRLDRTLSTKRKKSAYVDLGSPKPIDHIVITTETYTNGTYAVYGTAMRAGVTVVGTR